MSKPWLCIGLLVWWGVVHPAGSQTSKLIVLDHADELQALVVDGEDARELSGHVVIRQENVTIHCDRAVQFIASGKVLLTGHVVVRDDSMTITAPRGAYYRDTRHAEAYDRVVLDDGASHLEADFGTYDVDPRIAFFRSRVVARDTSSILTADTLRYERNRKLMHATGRVRVINERDAVTITGGDLVHDGVVRSSCVTLSPVLVKCDTTMGGAIDTLIVHSRVMESYQDSTRRLRATDSVVFVRKDLAGRAGSVLFHTAGDSLELRRSPVLWYQETQLTGDSINVYLRKRTLDRILVMGTAFAASQSDSSHPERFDQLAGETLALLFRERILHQIDVDVHAYSVYHLYEDSLANGLNKASGDRIVMFFADGRAKSIRVSGGVEGQYYPEPMVHMREREYQLPGLRWRDDRPNLRAPMQKEVAQ
jgi:lipopolysaccharide export system protein LptA